MLSPGADGGAMRFASGYEPVFSISYIDEITFDRINGLTWRPGCPVAVDDLRLLRLTYVDFDMNVQEGELICHRLFAEELTEIFSELYEAGFPIGGIRLIDEFGADDGLSMQANNCSAFNYRTVGGSQNLSRHAYGAAVDLNPVQNPYTDNRGAYVSPEAGREYLDRGDIRPGMITPGGVAHRAFTSRGWTWGGDWIYQIDYHHFQKPLPTD